MEFSEQENRAFLQEDLFDSFEERLRKTEADRDERKRRSSSSDLTSNPPDIRRFPRAKQQYSANDAYPDGLATIDPVYR